MKKGFVYGAGKKRMQMSEFNREGVKLVNGVPNTIVD